MPELPLVERARNNLVDWCLDAIVSTVWCDNTDDIVLRFQPNDLLTKLQYARVMGVKRRGKYVWLELKRHQTTNRHSKHSNVYCVFHLGMTGSFIVQRKKKMKNEITNDKDTEFEPKASKIILSFDNGVKFAFVNVRRLGRVFLFDKSPLLSSPVAKLGWDPLHSDWPTHDEFASKFLLRHCQVKSLLLDQTFCCGIGNWIADEVLYQARVHPQHICSELHHDAIQSIYDAVHTVITTAVKAQADSSRFPKSWLFHYRWNTTRKTQPALDFNGHRISLVTVGGRTSAFVPVLQYLHTPSSSSSSSSSSTPHNTSNPSIIKSRVQTVSAKRHSTSSSTPTRRSKRLAALSAHPLVAIHTHYSHYYHLPPISI